MAMSTLNPGNSHSVAHIIAIGVQDLTKPQWPGVLASNSCVSFPKNEKYCIWCIIIYDIYSIYIYIYIYYIYDIYKYIYIIYNEKFTELDVNQPNVLTVLQCHQYSWLYASLVPRNYNRMCKRSGRIVPRDLNWTRTVDCKGSWGSPKRKWQPVQTGPFRPTSIWLWLQILPQRPTEAVFSDPCTCLGRNIHGGFRT